MATIKQIISATKDVRKDLNLGDFVQSPKDPTFFTTKKHHNGLCLFIQTPKSEDNVSGSKLKYRMGYTKYNYIQDRHLIGYASDKNKAARLAKEFEKAVTIK